MAIKEQPGGRAETPDERIVKHEAVTEEARRSGIEVVSLAIDDADTGNDPYNQTGRFVSLALKDQAFD